MVFSKKELFKNFSIGFFPIVIFLVAELYYGAVTGIIVALIFGLSEFVFLYIKNRKIEKFIIFDIGLLMIFGAVSLLLKNDFFFKIKPAVFELILVVILAVHGFTNIPLLFMLGKRYMPDIKINKAQQQLIKSVSRIMFFVFLLHTFLIVWSAWYWSEEAWAFVSGGLFYILFGFIFVGQLIYSRLFKRKMMTNEI